MHISRINSFRREDNEAEICISDGEYSLNCYAYPVKSISLEQNICGLYGFSCDGIVKSYDFNFSIKKLPQYYAYCLTAKVVSTNDHVVQIGKIYINLDSELPKDIREGDYISFTVQRLDLNIF